MYTYEIRTFDGNGEKIGVLKMGSERDALAKFRQYRDNTIKAHEALDEAGLPTDCLAKIIELVYYGSMACSADAFGNLAGWQLSRNSDGMIIGGRYA